MGVDAVDGGVIPFIEVDGPDGQGEGVGSREAGIGGGAEIDRGDQAGLVLPAGQRGLAAQGGDGWAGLAVRGRCQGAGDLIGDVQGPARHALVCLVGQEDAVDGPAAPGGGVVGVGLDGGDGGGGSALGEGRGEGEREGQEGGGQKGQGGGAVGTWRISLGLWDPHGGRDQRGEDTDPVRGRQGVYLLTTYETRASHGFAAIRNDSRYSFGV